MHLAAQPFPKPNSAAAACSCPRPLPNYALRWYSLAVSTSAILPCASYAARTSHPTLHPDSAAPRPHPYPQPLLTELFMEADSDRSGFLDRHEFTTVLKNANLKLADRWGAHTWHTVPMHWLHLSTQHAGCTATSALQGTKTKWMQAFPPVPPPQVLALNPARRYPHPR